MAQAADGPSNLPPRWRGRTGQTLRQTFQEAGVPSRNLSSRTWTPAELSSPANRKRLDESGILGTTSRNIRVNPAAGMPRVPNPFDAEELAFLWGDSIPAEYNPERGASYRNYSDLVGTRGVVKSDDGSWEWAPKSSKPVNDEDLRSLSPTDRKQILDAQNALVNRDRPAPLTIVPTSTTDPDRPRTVAAGFVVTTVADAETGRVARGKLTVVFRDGTYYNYYDVPVDVWEAFVQAPSKGKFIRHQLDGTDPQALGNYDRGAADQGAIDARAATEVYRYAATTQKFRGYGHPYQRTWKQRGTSVNKALQPKRPRKAKK